MSRILYYIIILPLSYLPLNLLYLLSDLLYIIIYKLFSYRNDIVKSNIELVYPEKSLLFKKELKENFYRHFCDLIVEGIKAFTISNRELSKRYRIVGTEITKDDYELGKDINIAAGHYGNWEWASLACPLSFFHKCAVIVTPLSNSFLNNKIASSRSRNGYNIIPKSEVKKSYGLKLEKPQAYFFLIDQSPSNPKNALWIDFLGINTPVQYGLEKYSRLNNSPVYYISVHKIKRGEYEIRLRKLIDDPSKISKDGIIEIANREIEKDILSKPQYWLWSHRKWKHKKK